MHLYITTYGAFLHIKNGMFEVKYIEDGEEIKKKIPPKKVSGIVLDRGTSLTYEVVKTALEHNIDIVFAEGDGAPIGRVWHSKLGSTTKIRKRQLQASLNEEAVYWIKQWIADKIQNQIDFIKELKKHRAAKSDEIDTALDKLNSQKTKVEELEGDTILDIAGTLRGYEGTAGRVYFQLLSSLLSKEYQFKGRSFRPAEDPYNAFLNYGYGILYSRIEKCIMIAGLDPYVGFLHRDDYNQTSFVFDFIEPYRPFVDLTIYRLFSGKKVSQDHYHEITNGIGLTKEGKKLIVENFIQRFDVDKIRYRGRNQTRMNAIQQDAHTFANELISLV
ncbi:MAG: CRISPR-associated endonuclease Cas1 [Gracilimonas sp.]|uniref:CRISPR-associated endonuclease Cas1 n=1 Tax=Gracilimonas sp. TaxID=1974203 RepID=UPI003751C732|nr:CRISPR-associated endonuclease Cas1 [Gracilimonas sp.]